jgi:hypothetical protein
MLNGQEGRYFSYDIALPDERHLFIVLWDIRAGASRYAYASLAVKNSNTTFLYGKLNPYYTPIMTQVRHTISKKRQVQTQ